MVWPIDVGRLAGQADRCGRGDGRLQRRGRGDPVSFRVRGGRVEIQVPAKVTGTVAELPIHEGSKVAVGDLLVRLDSQSYEYDLLQAAASEEIAKVQLEELEQGSRVEDIEQLRANVEKADRD